MTETFQVGKQKYIINTLNGYIQQMVLNFKLIFHLLLPISPVFKNAELKHFCSVICQVHIIVNLILMESMPHQT